MGYLPRIVHSKKRRPHAGRRYIERRETNRPCLERWPHSRRASVRWRERSQIGLRATDGMTNQAMAKRRERTRIWRAAGDGALPSRGGKGGPRSARGRAAVLPSPGRAPKPGDPSDDADRDAGGPARVGPVEGAGGRYPSPLRASGGALVQTEAIHWVRTFQGSRDPRFEEKLQDGAGGS